MAWFSRFTRFGDMHLVYGQEANASCGIACVMMCVFKLNKLKPGATAVTIEKDVYKKYERALGSRYTPDDVGTYPQHLASVLNGFTSGRWKSHFAPPNDVAKILVDKVGVTAGLGPVLQAEPVIIGVDWDNGKNSHWVVVDTIRDVGFARYATICDPWDTNVHLQSFSLGSPFRYDASSGGLMIDFWGTSKGTADPYGNSAKGQVKTWGMIYRD